MLIFNKSNKNPNTMKKHITEIIRQAGEQQETKITEMVMIHFRDLGFELVKTKDVKKNKKKVKRQNAIITELIHENYAMSKALINAGIATVDAQIPDSANPISTQAATAGARQGAEAISTDLDANASITAIINSLDAHINKMTKTLDDANLTRIKYELDEQDALLDEPNAGMEDTAYEEAIQCYLKHLLAEPGTTPLQARLLALHEIAQTVPETGYDHYWIDAYEYLRTMQFTY